MRRYLFIGSVVFCALVLITVAVVFKLPSTPQAIRQDRFVAIENQTTSLEVVSSQIDSTQPGRELFRMVLKNISEKPIRAYLVKIGATGHTGAEFDLAPELFLPGATNTFQTPFPNIAQNNSPGNQLKVVIDLVYFDDDSAEGDWELAKRQREKYEGRALAFKTIRDKALVLIEAPHLNPLALSFAFDEIGQTPLPEGLTEAQKVGFQEGIQSLQSVLKLARQNQEQAPNSDEGRERMSDHNKQQLKRFMARGDADLTRRINRGTKLFPHSQGGIQR